MRSQRGRSSHPRLLLLSSLLLTSLCILLAPMKKEKIIFNSLIKLRRRDWKGPGSGRRAVSLTDVVFFHCTICDYLLVY